MREPSGSPASFLWFSTPPPPPRRPGILKKPSTTPNNGAGDSSMERPQNREGEAGNNDIALASSIRNLIDHEGGAGGRGNGVPNAESVHSSRGDGGAPTDRGRKSSNGGGTGDNSSSGISSMVHSDQEEEEVGKEEEDKEYEDVGDDEDAAIASGEGRRVRRMRKKRSTTSESSSSKGDSRDDSEDTDTSEVSSSGSSSESQKSVKKKPTSSSSSSSSASSSNSGKSVKLRRRDRHHSFGALTALAKRDEESRRRRQLQQGGVDGKAVRFADSLGLDLVKIKIFDAMAESDGDSHGYKSAAALVPFVVRSPDRTLLPLFQQPGSRSDFLALVSSQKVVLENAYTDPADQVSVRGVVRVLNMDFHKAVYIRWTLNEWRTMMDYKANYLMGSNDILTDKFTFKIYAPLDVGQSLVFAVRFHCVGDQFWDNNEGRNYRFVCTDQKDEKEEEGAEAAVKEQRERQQSLRLDAPVGATAAKTSASSSCTATRRPTPLPSCSSSSSSSSSSSGGLSVTSLSSMSSVTRFRPFSGARSATLDEESDIDCGIVIRI